MLTLYYAKGTCSLASHIALEEAGLEYRAERVDLASKAQQTPEYLAINPKGRVPALATEKGVLTETPAILTYIAALAPEAGLGLADDAFAHARLQSFMAYMNSTVHPAHAHRLRGSRWTDDPAAIEALKVKVPENMRAGFALIQNEIFEGPFVFGETYTVADPYLFTVAGWLEGDGVDIAEFPAINAHRQRMAERPAVQRVLQAIG